MENGFFGYMLDKMRNKEVKVTIRTDTGNATLEGVLKRIDKENMDLIVRRETLVDGDTYHFYTAIRGSSVVSVEDLTGEKQPDEKENIK
jgi:small nuclear ribonucleoprotein (snRNP)-like protein